MRWRDLRERVWRGIMSAKLDNGPALMDFTETESEEMLSLVPTTFRWGTDDADVGLNLKQRLAESLWGQSEQDAAEKRKQMRALFQEDQDALSPVSPASHSPNQDNAEDSSEG